MPNKTPVRIQATAQTLETSFAARTIAGTITLFDVVSDDHRVMWKAGSLAPREPIKRVKLLVDHDMTQPVGYMTAFTQPEGNTAHAVFYVPEGEAGDRALADAQHGRRDGFSVGVTLIDYEISEQGVIVVSSGQIHETSLCAIPAFQDAQVESVAAMLAATRKDHPMPELAPAPAAAAAVTPAPAAAAAVTPAPAAAAAVTPAPAAAAAPVMLASGERQPLPRTNGVTEPALTLAQAAARVSAAVASESPGAVLATLADIVPANDAGKGWLRDGWMGELWTAARTDRPWIEGFGATEQLTSMKIKGWAWGVRPKPAKWAGNKTDVPTNSPTTVPKESNAERWAGGWDIDRIYVDLGEAGFLESFWRAAMAEYKQDSNTDIGAKVLEAATDKGTSLTALDAIKATARDLRNIGASVSTIFLGNDVFDEYADLTQAEVPHWLANVVGGFDIANETANVGSLKIASNPDLDPDAVVGWDKRAAVVLEKTPIRVQALDVAKGGLDLGFFSYGGLMVNDPRAIVKRTVGAG